MNYELDQVPERTGQTDTHTRLTANSLVWGSLRLAPTKIYMSGALEHCIDEEKNGDNGDGGDSPPPI